MNLHCLLPTNIQRLIEKKESAGKSPAGRLMKSEEARRSRKEGSEWGWPPTARGVGGIGVSEANGIPEGPSLLRKCELLNGLALGIAAAAVPAGGRLIEYRSHFSNPSKNLAKGFVVPGSLHVVFRLKEHKAFGWNI